MQVLGIQGAGREPGLADEGVALEGEWQGTAPSWASSLILALFYLSGKGGGHCRIGIWFSVTITMKLAGVESILHPSDR